ncbi:ATP-binding protein [Flavimaribacter sediminis]|nr:ATP-binding protein [Flavimaribacter sediminis]
MAAVSVFSSIVGYLFVYLAYVVAEEYVSNFQGWLPFEIEFSVLLLSIVPALMLTGWIAIRLTRRILAPLNSLATGAQRIAAGDLSARADPGDLPLSETALLISDFNTMASRLQDMTNNLITWNAAIAHELRTPLTILCGKIQGVVDGVIVADERLFHSLLLQINSLGRLVDDLRVVSLSESGHLDLRKDRMDLSEQIGSVIEVVRAPLIESGFRLETNLVDIEIFADGDRIRQALHALLENVRRYAVPGLLNIETLRLNNNILIRVEDSGPGLAPEFVKRAFEPFERADPSRSRHNGGSGLGLSVVRVIAEGHGGESSYRRSSRGGSIFEISLPLT